MRIKIFEKGDDDITTGGKGSNITLYNEIISHSIEE